MSLLLANIIYVFYRLAVSGPLVKLSMKYMPYYAAVFLMAQLSFLYDNFNFYFYFQPESIEISTIIIADALYTLRVLAAWWLIKKIWDYTNNYWFSVFIGAEITFIVDYFIFNGSFGG